MRRLKQSGSIFCLVLFSLSISLSASSRQAGAGDQTDGKATARPVSSSDPAGVSTSAPSGKTVAASTTKPINAPTQKFALLVGCTEYPNHPQMRTLYGPKNDVALWKKFLTDPQGFGFPTANVRSLVGWPDEESERPSYANIKQGFETLIQKAAPNVQIVILLAGHGVQIPIPPSQKDPLDPRNPEPDGLDEVYLPADAESFDDKGLKNGLTDNQIGAWLDQMRAKGASVWIVFDCCHSGTMTRGSAVEVSRAANPADLGIKPEEVESARRRAAEAVKAAKAAGRPIGTLEQKVRPLGTSKEGAGNVGSLVAFYAAQPFEEAPELPLPQGSPVLRENYYGLFSYTMVQALGQRRSPLSYRELSRFIAGQYRVSRGARGPVPFAEGDLDREVLGANIWPDDSPILLEKKGGALQVNAGELQGVTRGSILSVAASSSATGSAAGSSGTKVSKPKILGHVRVISSTPTAATVQPVEFGQQAAVEADTLPSGSKCEVVVRDYGDTRLRLRIDSHADLKKAYEKIDPGVRGMILPVEKDEEAEWLLRYVTPAEASEEFGLAGVSRPRVLLVPSRGQARVPQAAREPKTGTAQAGEEAATKSTVRKVFGLYATEDPRALTGALERDLPKIFKWQNLWRVAGGLALDAGSPTHGLQVEMRRLNGDGSAAATGGEQGRGISKSTGELVQNGLVRNGDTLQLRLKNSGRENLWYSVFFMEANFGIQLLESGSVQAGKEAVFDPYTVEVQGKSHGVEGIVVLAVPQSVEGVMPDYKFLEQEPLSVADARKRSAIEVPKNPFGELVSAAVFNARTRSSLKRKVPSTPAVISVTWYTMP